MEITEYITIQEQHVTKYPVAHAAASCYEISRRTSVLFPTEYDTKIKKKAWLVGNNRATTNYDNLQTTLFVRTIICCSAYSTLGMSLSNTDKSYYDNIVILGSK